MAGLSYALGRVLVSVLFVVTGYEKFMSIGGIARMLAAKSIPAPIELESWTGLPRYEVEGYAVALIEVLCGIMVLIGFKARFAAIVLVLLTIGTVFVGHDFWTMEGAARAANQTQALKNLSIMGALLLIAAAGAGPWSFDGRSRGA
jgi:putative oxidoreductase